MTPRDLLEHGHIEVVGRLREASNQTFAIRVVSGDTAATAVYKPIAGEAPLWDFPEGTLAAREYSAYLVSEALGWNIVPLTLLREGPAGKGMVQMWIEADDVDSVGVVKRGEESGYLHVLDAEDRWGRPASLVHEDTVSLRRIALFDLIINNTDRKGSHILARGAHRYGIDHGVCFHVDDKVRTVLWGWGGSELQADERTALEALLADVPLHESLRSQLDDGEVDALDERCRRLLTSGRLPLPRGDWPPIPWPPL